jgi:Flp pilus assembly pilin Flp
MRNSLLIYLFKAKIWHDEYGQDFVEYALMAGFITVAVAATFPPAANDISTIFSRLASVTEAAQ